jgi:VanZ family protein
MTRRRLYLAMLAAWVALTLALTSIPNPDFGSSFSVSDKFAHFCFYGVAGFLCALWRREAGRTRSGAILYAVAFVALLGVLDEIHQRWIPGRSMEFFDWVADVSGGTAGSLVSAALSSMFPSLLSRGNQSVSRAVTD